MTTGWTLAPLGEAAAQWQNSAKCGSVFPVCGWAAGCSRVCAWARLSVLCSHAILPATCLGHFLSGRQPDSRVLLGAEQGGRRCQAPKAGLGSRKRELASHSSISGQHRKTTQEARGLPGCRGEMATGETAVPSSRGQGWREPAPSLQSEILCNSRALCQMMSPAGRRR